MTKHGTAFLAIPKERAATILSDKLENKYSGVYATQKDDGIKLYTNKNDYWVVSLYDHKMQTIEIEIADVKEVEGGILGCKMNYRTTSGSAGSVGKAAKSRMSEYIV